LVSRSLCTRRFQDLPDRFQAIQPGHANVQNKKIWFQLPALLHRIPSVSGLSANFPHAEKEIYQGL
jgi:hypothetical protein